MLYLCRLRQMVRFEKGITGFLESGQKFEGLFESEPDAARWLLLGRALHAASLPGSCISFAMAEPASDRW